jgi:hypothetical protein
VAVIHPPPLDRRHHALHGEHAAQPAAPAGDDHTALAGGQHRVQRVVEGGAQPDDRKPLVDGGRHGRRPAQLGHRRPADRPATAVQDDDEVVPRRPGRGDHRRRVRAHGGRGDRAQLDVLDPGQGELLEGGTGADEVRDVVLGRVGQDRLRGVVLHDPGADVEHDDPVAELHGLVEVVGDADDGLAQLVLDPQQLVLQPHPGDRVDRPERLVHQQHRRVRGQRPGDADALLLPAGERAGVAVAVGGRVQPDQVQQLLGAVGDPALVPAEHPGHQRDVGRHRHVREEPTGLDDVADPAAQPVGVLGGDVLVAQEDLPAGGLDEPVQHLEQRRLPAARRAHEHHRLPGRDLQRHRVDRGPVLPGVALGDPLQPDGQAAGPPSHGRRRAVRHGSPWGW